MNETPAQRPPVFPDKPQSALAVALARLSRLEGFLEQDPANPALRIDTFEAALAAGEWARARVVLHAALADTQTDDPPGWRLREGDLWLAQGRHDEARTVYAGIQVPDPAPPGLTEVLLHNLAFIDFAQGRFREAIDRLAPPLERAGSLTHAPFEVRAPAYRLWLRALHHDGQLERAMAWLRDHAGALGGDPSVLGVASLIALDAGDFERTREWAAASVAVHPDGWRSPEGLVAVASLALYAGDATTAAQAAGEAVHRAPSEGRAWSALAFSQLLAHALEPARSAFLHAVERMPLHIGTWHGLGWTQLLLGDREGAMQSFMRALALDRNFAESHGAVAVVHALSSREDEARHAAELALRLDAANLSGRYAQALLSGEGRDPDSLRRLTRRLLGGRTHGVAGIDLADWIQGRQRPRNTP